MDGGVPGLRSYARQLTRQRSILIPVDLCTLPILSGALICRECHRIYE